MMILKGSQVIETWPEESREAAALVIKKYGEPDEVTDSLLIWNNPGPWKKMIAHKYHVRHDFPAPHVDAVESFVDYRVPAEKFDDLAEFDGSVIVERTAGVMSARCHDEEANFLALNLADDIVKGKKSAREAREYYAHEFIAYREKEPTPYMNGLRFKPGGGTKDPDERLLSDEDLEAAVDRGRQK